MKQIILLYFAFSISLFANAQNLSINRVNEAQFINHLIDKDEYCDAIFYISKIEKLQNFQQSFTDSLNFYKGWSYYSLKQLDSSSYFLEKVSKNSTYFLKSLFFSSYENAYLNRFEKADSLLGTIKTDSSLIVGLIDFERAGISLLNHDTNNFEKYSKHFTQEFYPFAEQELNLKNYKQAIAEFKPKSMFLAGTLSAVVPGLGKLYAGKPGEAVSAFLISGSLIAVFVENYIKRGTYNYFTIISGTVATIFYVGNIYGSVVSIKRYRNEFNEKITNNILFDLHIPLRTIFN